MKKDIQIYKTDNGVAPFFVWMNDIKNNLVISKVLTRIDRVSIGHYGDYKSVGNGVLELRIHYSPGYRIYFAEYENDIVILLLGGSKNSQTKDIKKAKKYWKDFIVRSKQL